MLIGKFGQAILLLTLVFWAGSAISQDTNPPSGSAEQLLLLGSQNETIRTKAISTLADYGEAIIPSIIEEFSSTNVHVRESAIDVLGRIGEATIPAVLEALTSDSAQVRATAARAFVLTDFGDSHQFREAIGSSLIFAIRDAEPNVRRSAAQALWEFEDENAIPYLPNRVIGIDATHVFEELSHPDINARRKALETLSNAIEADPLDSGRFTEIHFSPLLQDDDPIVRKVAVWMIGHVSRVDQETQESVLHLLVDPDPGVRAAAAIVLGGFDYTSEESIQQLRVLLDDNDDLVRASAAISLALIGEHGEKLVLALQSGATYLDEDTREDAALALANLGPQALTALPVLKLLLDDVFPEVKSAASLALGQIGEEAYVTVPELRDALQDHNATVRTQATRALGRIGPRAAAAVPELRMALKDRNPTVRAAAARSLSQIGYAADIAMPELRASLEDSSQLVRKFSAEALTRIAAAIGEAAPNLDVSARRTAVENLVANEDHLTAAANADAGNLLEYNNALTATRGALDAIASAATPEKSIISGFLFWAVSYAMSLTALWLIVFAFRPIWLFKINQALEPFEFFVPRALGNNKFSVRHMLLIGFYYTHPRVLNAWVKSKLPVVRTSFDNMPRVKSHESFAKLGMKLDGIDFSLQEIERLHQTFQQKPGCLLVHGECGIGKTNFAIQLGRKILEPDSEFCLTDRPMLPVVIDHNLQTSAATVSQSGRSSRSRGVNEEIIDPLVEAIRGQLQELTRSPLPVSRQFINALLRSQYLLVFIDGITEMDENSRQLIRPEQPEFLINALVITARNDGFAPQISHSSLSLERVTAKTFSGFLNATIELQANNRNIDAATQESMESDFADITGQTGVPALFARIFCELWLKSTTEIGMKPESMGDIETGLLQRFIADICVRHGRLSSFRTVWEDVENISLSCICNASIPETVSRITAISVLGGDEPEVRLRNLERRLSIIQSIPPSLEEIMFSIHSLPAHLAAIKAFQLRNDQPELFQSTITAAREGSSESELRRIFLRSIELRLGRPLTEDDFRKV